MPVRHSAYSVKFSSIMQWQREFIIYIDTTVLYTRDRCHPIKLTIQIYGNRFTWCNRIIR